MQNNTIKNLSLALAICLGSAAGFSMDKHANTCLDESRPQKPVWGAKITSDQTSAFHHGVKLTVSKCGKTIDIAGDSDCIGVKERKSAVQALQLALIMQGLNNQLTHSYVGELITGYEHCPCPKTKNIVAEVLTAVETPKVIIGGLPGVNPSAKDEGVIKARDIPTLTDMLLGYSSDSEDDAHCKKQKKK